ncbi:O-acyltransferase like protein-like [Oratosquilla oratoria]|uniref:O-acyltransferase like protein-like n=1 Tax=Oratosquilla oratoria TaxID=337810 RepID=UPI003F762289
MHTSLLPGLSHSDILLRLRRDLGHHYLPVLQLRRNGSVQNLKSPTSVFSIEGKAKKNDTRPAVTNANLCLAQSLLQLVSVNEWSLRMWDASGKIPDGIRTGASEARGRPSLCRSSRIQLEGGLASQLQVHGEDILEVARRLDLDLNRVEVKGGDDEPAASATIRGKYCLVTLRRGNVKGFLAGGASLEVLESLAHSHANTYATCIPDTCTPDILKSSVQEARRGEGIEVAVHCDEVYEEPTTSRSFTKLDLTFCILAGLLVAVGGIASYIDEARRQREEEEEDMGASGTRDAPSSKGEALLQCFNAAHNTRRLFSVDNNEPDSFSVLHGLKVWSMIWVIYGHRYMLMLTTVENSEDILQHRTEAKFWLASNAFPSVDTFFFVSAFLIAVFFPRLCSSRRFLFVPYVMTRYLRLIPTLGFAMLFCTTVLRFLSSEPIWVSHFEASYGTVCRNNWWTNLLLINNFFDAKEMCMGQSWSLAVEWQLYLITPLVLLPIYRRRATGEHSARGRVLGPLGVMVAFSALVPTYVIYSKNLPPTGAFGGSTITETFYNLYYIMPWCRAGPYALGLAAGVLYNSLRDKQFRVSQTTRILGWAASLTALTLVIVAPNWWKSSQHSMGIFGVSGRVWAALYAGVSKHLWALSLAFITIMVSKGHGGVVGRFLSLPVYRPLSRLSYCMSLVSLPLQTFAALRPNKMQYDSVMAAYLVVGDLIFSFVAAVLLCVFVEAPSSRLLSLAISGKMAKKSKEAKESSEKSKTSTEDPDSCSRDMETEKKSSVTSERSSTETLRCR